MARRRRIIAGCLAVAGTALLLWTMSPLWLDRQPIHEGRTVTDWSLDLLSPSHSARTNATQALKTIGPDAVPVLGRQLRQRNSWMRAPFLAVSSQLPVSWRRAFVRFFQPFRSMDERLAAVTALPLFGTNVPADLFLETLGDPERQLANLAATALGRYGSGAVSGLTIALQDANPEVRSLACSALSQIGRPAAPAVSQLAVLLSDPDPQLMAQAIHALTMIGPAAVPHLVQALEHPQPRVREKAAFALGQLRFAARSAMPALERRLEDEDLAVRKHAHAALQAIAPRATR
jgi:hypothetical protein